MALQIRGEASSTTTRLTWPCRVALVEVGPAMSSSSPRAHHGHRGPAPSTVWRYIAARPFYRGAMHIGGKFTGGGPIFEDGVGACLPRVTATSDHVIGSTTAAPRDGAPDVWSRPDRGRVFTAR